ncbi:MAG: hypothetical protein WD059_10070 [Balneolaceae bacterium]
MRDLPETAWDSKQGSFALRERLLNPFRVLVLWLAIAPDFAALHQGLFTFNPIRDLYVYAMLNLDEWMQGWTGLIIRSSKNLAHPNSDYLGC